MADDYYKTLGVTRSATHEEIQKSYRKLARKYHPDLHSDRDEKEKKSAKQNFQKVQQAYDVLSDPEKRKLYDQYGDQFEQMSGAGNPYAGAAGGGMGGFEEILRGMGGGARGANSSRAGTAGMGGIEDFLRQMGGAGGLGGEPRGGPRSAAPQKPDDLVQEITIPFATAVLGGKHQLSFVRGDGKPEAIDVKIPAGIESLQKIRLRGQGHPNPRGGPAGDLKITVKIAAHPQYTRNGLNLGVTVPISILEAAQGAKIDLPTPHGTVTVSVPAGSSSGKPLRLRGMGIKTQNRSGDLIATLQIVVPENISANDIEQLKKLSSVWQEPTRKQLAW